MPLSFRGCSRVVDRERVEGDPHERPTFLRLKTTFLLAVLSFAFGAGSVTALDSGKDLDQFTIDSWKSGKGLPVNSVTTIVQTEDGYLWLGTQSGLVQFDGIGSRIYHRRNTASLVTSIVWSLLPLRSGELLIGLEDGGVVLFRDGKFEPIDFEALNSATVMALFEDEDGTIWIGTEDGRIFLSNNEMVEPYTDENGLGGSIRAFVSAGEGAVWAASEGSGIWRLGKDGTRSNINTSDGLPTDVVISLGTSKDGGIWVGTHAGGAVWIRGKEMNHYSLEQGLAHETVNEVIEDSDGNVWFATQRGLSRLRSGAGITTLTARQGLDANVVRCLLEDREGSLWIGTGGGGLVRLKDTPVTTYAARQGLDFDHVWTVFEGSAQTIWIGTAGGGLYRLKEGRAGPAFSTANGLSNDTVLSLCETLDGSLWVGTRSGLNRIKNNSIQVFMEEDGLPNAFVRVLSRDRKGRLWIGTRGGLAVYDQGRFITYGIEDGMTHDVIRFVHEARDGTIWIGTNGGGLNRFDEKGFSAITTENGLSTGYIFAIHEDASGTIWAGSNEGLNRVRDGHVDVLTIDNGLPDDFFYRIMEDNSGRIWASTNAGIVAVPVSALNAAIDDGDPIAQLRVFGTADGMLNPECNGGVQPAGWKDQLGRFWFPTVQGVVRVDPSALRTNMVPPNVVIEKVVAEGATLGQELSAPVRLEPGTSRFELHYAALSLLDPAKVRYRYRLHGFEPDWTDADTRRTAYYTNVPPGQYTFQVRGCNNDGVWSTEAALLDIEVIPTFRQTGWMIVIYLVAGLGLIAAVFLLRSQQVRRRENRLLELVDERTAQLEAVNSQLEVLVNQDGLTGITNRRHFMERYEQEWKRCIRNARWISIVLADIDDFKAFNDSYGHQSGDECLQRIAKTMEACTQRPADLVARYGGEEFIVLLPETEVEGAFIVAEAMRRSVLELGIQHKASRAGDIVTVSFGVAGMIPVPSTRNAALIELADEALYSAKEAGRNRTVKAAVATMSRKEPSATREQVS